MEQLKALFADWAGEACDLCLALGAGGSNRRYYRLTGGDHSCIGAVATDVRENEAFFAYSRHLYAKGMPVPELYAVADDRIHYLQQDLGDQTLYGLLLDKRRKGQGFDTEMMDLYRQALTDLAAIQQAGVDMDFSKAYPRAAFDRQSMLWDLNYFKYFFLKLTDCPFDEQCLEDDFATLTDFLLQTDCNYFLYRDFQGRNIMVGDKLYYIDYQGGRRGAAQYDVASLLYSAKSDLPEAYRQELLNHYLDVRGIGGAQRRQWLDHFWGYVLVRILQTLGAYGFRGLYEHKPYFVESIPLALGNLRNLSENHPDLLANLPHLKEIVECKMNNVERADAIQRSTIHSSLSTIHSTLPTLTVTVMSFSYKQGMPEDPSGNGGGFVFDCRALPNPGRYTEYKPYTGKDRPVVEFLQREEAVDCFLNHAKALVGQSIEKYMERRFSSLQVAFGCTGGQHRSVYCTEQLARWIGETYSCNVVVHHREQDR